MFPNTYSLYTTKQKTLTSRNSSQEIPKTWTFLRILENETSFQEALKNTHANIPAPYLIRTPWKGRISMNDFHYDRARHSRVKSQQCPGRAKCHEILRK